MVYYWPPDQGILDANPKWAELTSGEKENFLVLATRTLIMLTNQRVGLAPVTIRPFHERQCGWCRNPITRTGPLGRCSASGGRPPQVSEYEIPGPVGFIDSVKIDGAEVDIWSGDWRLDDGFRLVWQGAGPSPLPPAQDLSKPDTEDGTWSITYSRSYAIGSQGSVAVASLALEFMVGSVVSARSKERCTLPRGVRTVQRNGVQFTIEAGLFPNGLTGNDLADAFILRWSPPGSPTRSAVVLSPRAVLQGRAEPRTSSPIPARRFYGSV